MTETYAPKILTGRRALRALLYAVAWPLLFDGILAVVRVLVTGEGLAASFSDFPSSRSLVWIGFGLVLGWFGWRAPSIWIAEGTLHSARAMSEKEGLPVLRQIAIDDIDRTTSKARGLWPGFLGGFCVRSRHGVQISVPLWLYSLEDRSELLRRLRLSG